MTRKRVLLLLLAFLALPSVDAETAALQPPQALVTVSGPEEVAIGPDAPALFQVHVRARIECARGFPPPPDLVLEPMPRGEDEGTAWQVRPAAATVPWQPAPTESDAYVLEALVTFNATLVDAQAGPTTGAVGEALLLVRETERDRTGIHCSVDGYAVESEEHHVVFVRAQEEQAATTDQDDGPEIHWAPLGLAVVILAALAAFAGVRERGRR